jgi:hypothetical protein
MSQDLRGYYTMRFWLIILLLIILLGAGPVLKALGVLVLIIIGLPLVVLFVLILLLGLLD